MPAVDFLNLGSNEGEDYAKRLSLLFAASGNLRHVVKTMASVPESYTNTLAVTMNDRDTDVTARNIIMLLVALTCEDVAKAVDCIVHRWYSAFLRAEHMAILQDEFMPLLQEVNAKIEHKNPGSAQARTWNFGRVTFRIVLTKEQWQALPSYLVVSDGLSTAQAHNIRKAVTLAPSRIDYRERCMCTCSPTHRVCSVQFYEGGILLPFGTSRSGFDVPNPTLFQTNEWPMMDSAEPILGWHLSDVLKTDVGAAKNDVYGKLFHHAKDSLTSFHRYISKNAVEFHIFQKDATELLKVPEIQASSFARVEVSNICDVGYLGIASTLHHLAPLLQSPKANPHATFITLFMNAVGEMYHVLSDQQTESEEMKRLDHHLPTTSDLEETSKDFALVTAAMPNVRDGDKFFDIYMKQQRLYRMEQLFNVAIKPTNTIVDKWPLRLKFKPQQKGAKEEFNILLCSGHPGTERYVEWKRTS